jgi:uncharacterized protein Usg
MFAQNKKLIEMEDSDQLERNNLAYILHKWTVATVQVVYYIPDYLHVVNEFMWQTEDQIPNYPRITKFLDYWDKNIDGPIKEVYIYDQGQSNIRKVDRRFKMN